MTFSIQIKDEIASEPLNEIENRYLLLGYLFVNAAVREELVSVSLENASIARKLFKTFKYSYKLEPKITVRTQKKFYLKKIFIIEIKDKTGVFLSEFNNLEFFDNESKVAFIKGIFLSAGSVSDPKKSGYHLELTFADENKALFVLNILSSLEYNFKIIKRDKGYMLYIKAGEEISDFLKLLGTVNSLFYFEDIRIYRDHKNMVNRLNNCEQANYEKSLKTADKQAEMINYLHDNDYFSLLDDKTKQVAEYRIKYPEVSFQALADIISNEINKKVTKSYINHHFRKISEVYNRIIKSEQANK